MKFGDRIRFFRRLRGLTQKQLGIAVGFTESNADIRIAQYENSSRTPKQHVANKMADILGVSYEALTVQNFNGVPSITQLLFALEDMYGFKVDMIDGEPIIHCDKDQTEIRHILSSWFSKSEKLHNNELSKEMYDDWRYNFKP